MASLAGFELGGIEMDLGELCQDRDWALNFFTQCEEVQMAAMSKDRQLAMSQVSIKYATFLFFLNDETLMLQQLPVMNIVQCLGACLVPSQCQGFSRGQPMWSRLVF